MARGERTLRAHDVNGWVAVMVSSLPALRCPWCGAPIELGEPAGVEPHSHVTCVRCHERSPLLGVAAAAWAAGSISREQFLDVVDTVTGHDVEVALAALAQAASWWEDRTERLDARRPDER